MNAPVMVELEGETDPLEVALSLQPSYGHEIAAYDIQTTRCDLYGQGISKIEPNSNLQHHVEIKTPDQIDEMRETCGITREVFDVAAHVIRPRITTDEIDAVVHEATIAVAVESINEGVSFQQSSGFITIDEKKDRPFFYYFVEADTEPASKPLVLLLSGGPGCSSVGIGAFVEHGPFKPSGNVLIKNDYSWNKGANVLYLESPPGVGFSYYANKSFYQSVDDEMTVSLVRF